MKIKVSLYLLLCVVFFPQCADLAGPAGKAGIAGRWKSISVEHQVEDSMMQEEKNKLLDQIGQLDVLTEKLKEQFNSGDLDSIKAQLSQETRTRYARLQEGLKKERFEIELLPQQVAVFARNGGPGDSAAWYLVAYGEQQVLIVDQHLLKGNGQLMHFLLREQSGDTLVMQYYSTGNFPIVYTLTRDRQ